MKRKLPDRYVRALELTDLFRHVHGFTRLRLIGTEYYLSAGWLQEGETWWWKHVYKHKYNIEDQQKVTFEEVLDNVPAHVQEGLLFHLDLFT